MPRMIPQITVIVISVMAILIKGVSGGGGSDQYGSPNLKINGTVTKRCTRLATIPAINPATIPIFKELFILEFNEYV